MKAIWNDKIIAESENWIELDNNIYFPLSGVRQQYLAPSTTTTVCPWKGIAHYYDVVVAACQIIVLFLVGVGVSVVVRIAAKCT